MPLDIEQSLGKKIGPLPMGVWAVIIGGGAGLIYLLTKRQGQQVPIVDVTSPDTSLAAIQRTAPGYIPTPVPIYDTSGPVSGTGTATPTPPPYYKPNQNPQNRGTIPPVVPPYVPAPPTNIPIPSVTPNLPAPPAPPPTTPSAPPPPPAKERTAIYPGLPAGYVLDCSKSYTGLHGSYTAVYSNQKLKGQGDTFTKRNMMAIALQGGTSPWAFTGDFNNAASINNRRIRYGLIPLTQNEIDTALNQLGQWSKQGGDKALIAHAEEFFNSWSVPYQCTGGNTIRQTR